MSRVGRTLPWAWTGMLVMGSIGVVIFQYEPSITIGRLLGVAVVLLLVVLLAALGAVIGARNPGNPISWVFYAISTGLFLTVAASGIIPDPGPPSDPTIIDLLAMYASQAWVAIFYPLFLLLFIFPTGHFPSRRWRWGGWLGWVIGLASLTAVFTDPIGAPFAEPPWAIENPIGFLPPSVLDWASVIGTTAFPLAALGGFAAIFVRYRTSEDLVRTQIKWVVYAAFITVLAFAAIQLGIGADNGDVAGLWFFAVISLIPTAVFIAITRYKLFEIDRIISRTVGYAVVAGLLALIFAAGVTWIPSALDLGDSPLLVAGSTLAVAALFNPLRIRVQRIVDRRFNRSHYQARIVSDQFATRLRASLTVDELAEVWTETVDRHLQPEASGVWLRDA